MSGVVDPGEGQVAILAHLATDVALIDHDVGIAGGGEGRGVGWNEVGEREGGVLPGVPVADDVCITVD